MLFLVELGAAVTASTVATGDAPGTADAAVGGAIVERHLRSISLVLLRAFNHINTPNESILSVWLLLVYSMHLDFFLYRHIA